MLGPKFFFFLVFIFSVSLTQQFLSFVHGIESPVVLYTADT